MVGIAPLTGHPSSLSKNNIGPRCHLRMCKLVTKLETISVIVTVVVTVIMMGLGYNNIWGRQTFLSIASLLEKLLS